MSHYGQASASDGSLVSPYAGGTSGLEPGNRNRSDFHSIHLSLFTSSYAERSLKPAREHSEKASQPRWVPGRRLQLVVAGRWVMAIQASSNGIGHHSTQKAGSLLSPSSGWLAGEILCGCALRPRPGALRQLEEQRLLSQKPTAWGGI
jgi:hypothetical protein